MKKCIGHQFTPFTPDERADNDSSQGTTMIEYALMALLICAACVAAVTFLGGQTNTSYSKSASGLTN